jgi:xanthine dehydrogenase accessory factor
VSRFVRDYVAKAQEFSAQGISFVTITLIQPEGHVPQDIGAKAIVTEAGLAWGTVGGGRLEARAIEHAQGMLARAAKDKGASPRVPELVRYDLKQDLNMVCGGVATVFYELAANSGWTIAVFGAGHVAQAVVPLLASFDCTVYVIDHREEWLARIAPRANVKKILASDVSEDLPARVWELPEDVFYLCVTQGHATDLPVVRQILKRGHVRFLGVIGSVPKARTMRANLMSEGFTGEQLSAIHCPVGLPFGTNAPAEIAVSIAAQILQKRDELWKVP